MTFIFVAAVLVVRILSNPAGNVFQKQLTERGFNPLFINFITYFILSICCIPFIVNFSYSAIQNDIWVYSALVGIAGALGNAFLIKALQGGELSVLGPINSYKSVVGLIAGVFLLGEMPNVWGIAGTGLIIAGSYLVIGTQGEKFTWNILRQSGILYRVLALILTAVEAVFLKKVILYSSPETAFIVWCISGAFFSFLLLFFFRVKLKSCFTGLHASDMKRFILLVFSIGLMQLSTNYVFKMMPVGYALALFQLSVIITVILGHKIFHEEKLWLKLSGSVIMAAGSVLIILLK